MSNPDIGSRCSECRLGLGVHTITDPYCYFFKSRCTDVYMLAEGNEVIEYECVHPDPGYRHTHFWKEFQRSKRCTIRMNDFRCQLWENHNNGCHSKELMFELAGEKYF